VIWHSIDQVIKSRGALAITAVLLAGYYLLPLDRLSSVPMGLTLALGLLALAAVAAIQVRAVIRARDIRP
jgi:voltage-gated potassium channel